MEENLRLLISLAQQLTYKPNHVFFVRRIDAETALVSLRCPSLPNAVPGNGPVGLTINNTVKLAAIITPSDALQAFAKVVADFELHEAAEFFQHHGRTVFLPHGWGDEFGGFTWSDFTNLSGKFLDALKTFLNHAPSTVNESDGEPRATK